MLDTVCLQVTPKKLLRDLATKERDSSPVLLDLCANSIAEQSTCFELEVIFQQIELHSQGLPLAASYSVATVGASVSITASGAELVSCTEPPSASVEYSVTNATANGRKRIIAPEIELAKLKSKLGSAETDREQHQETTAKFTSEEHLIVATKLGDTIRWNIDLPRTSSIVRDYLIGNKHLQATFKWKTQFHKGTIEIKPTLHVFDSEKRMLTPQASLMIRFRLWMESKRKLANEKGFSLWFLETK